MNQQLIDYINQSRQHGATDSQIRQALLSSGWQESDFGQYFNSPSQNPTPLQYALPSAQSLFGQSIKWYTSHFQIILGITVIPLILSIFGFFISDIFTSPSLGIAIIGFLYVIVTLLAGFISKLALFGAVVDEGSTVGSAYKKGLSLFWAFIWVSFLTILSAIGGYVLLIIPGIIISIFLGQSTYVLFVEGNRGTASLVKSWHYVKGRAIYVLYWSVFFGIVILSMSFVVDLLLGDSTLLSQIKNIGYTTVTTTQPVASKLSQIIDTIINQIILIPLGIIYAYLVFATLKATKSEPLDEVREREIKKKITIFMVIGIIGTVGIFVLMGILLLKLTSGLYPTSLMPNSSLFSTIGLPLLDYLPFGK